MAHPDEVPGAARDRGAPGDVVPGDEVDWPRMRLFRTDRESEALEGLDAIPGSPSDEELLWIEAPPRHDLLRGIEERVGLDGLLAGLTTHARPSFRQHEDTLRISVIGLRVQGDGPAALAPLHLVASRNVVVSVHEGDVAGLTSALDQVAADRRLGRQDAGTFVGLLLDGVLGGYYEEIERIERRIDRFDESVLHGRSDEAMLDELLDLRRWTSRLRRALAPQRDVFAALARPVGEASPVGAPWPELATRLADVIDAVEQARQTLMGSFDLLMTRTGQRTNDTMRTLTVLSSILLPAGVIAGIMGMNFPVPFFDQPQNFLLVVGLMVVIALATLVLARLRGWI